MQIRVQLAIFRTMLFHCFDFHFRADKTIVTRAVKGESINKRHSLAEAHRDQKIMVCIKADLPGEEKLISLLRSTEDRRWPFSWSLGFSCSEASTMNHREEVLMFWGVWDDKAVLQMWKFL